jgi:hypothetical protein
VQITLGKVIIIESPTEGKGPAMLPGHYLSTIQSPQDGLHGMQAMEIDERKCTLQFCKVRRTIFAWELVNAPSILHSFVYCTEQIV